MVITTKLPLEATADTPGASPRTKHLSFANLLEGLGLGSVEPWRIQENPAIADGHKEQEGGTMLPVPP